MVGFTTERGVVFVPSGFVTHLFGDRFSLAALVVEATSRQDQVQGDRDHGRHYDGRAAQHQLQHLRQAADGVRRGIDAQAQRQGQADDGDVAPSRISSWMPVMVIMPKTVMVAPPRIGDGRHQGAELGNQASQQHEYRCQTQYGATDYLRHGDNPHVLAVGRGR